MPLFPRVMGHEGVGRVESVGEGVTEFKEGDIVIPTYIGECKECMNCQTGKTNMCHKYPFQYNGLMSDGTSRMSIRGQKLYHLFSCSTWSEFMVVNANYVVKVHPSLPLQSASLISCSFTTGFGAAWKEADVQKGSTVAIFGLGGVGLGVVSGASVLGATKIIGVDLNEKKKEKGMMFGMTHFVNPKASNKSLSERIKEMTGGLGVDFSFECTGIPELLNQAFQSTREGIGITIAIGAIDGENVAISLLALMSGKTLKGSIFGGVRPHSDIPLIIQKCINKELQPDALVTHQVQMEDINHALELVKQPDCLKVVIQIDSNK